MAENKSEAIRVNVDPATKTELEQRAAQEDVPVAQLVRRAIKLFLATTLALLVFAAQPAQAEAPTLNERVTHLEASMDGLLYQLENCIPKPVRWKTVRTTHGTQTLYVAVMTEKQKRVCFAGHAK